jgi:hypothetical protein
MAFTYTTGTVSVANGSTAVTGTLTAFSALVREGDLLLIGNSMGVIAADPATDTALTLVNPWGGSTVSGAAYVIALFSPRHNWPTDVWQRIREALLAAKTVTVAATNPGSSDGVVNDIWFNSATMNFFYKSGSGWSAGVSMIGATGPATTITVGNVTLGPPNRVKASMRGTAPNQILDLTLPRGRKGDKGDIGLTGSPGPSMPFGNI